MVFRSKAIKHAPKPFFFSQGVLWILPPFTEENPSLKTKTTGKLAALDAFRVAIWDSPAQPQRHPRLGCFAERMKKEVGRRMVLLLRFA